MEKKLTPIKLDSYQPLREVVCETLRDAIRKGVLAPGERLMEIQLAEVAAAQVAKLLAKQVAVESVATMA